jgi:hypothetical protein
MEAHPAGTATEVEDASTHEAHGAPFLWPPPPKRRQVVAAIAREHEAIIPFNDLDHLLAGDQIHQQTAESVLLRTKNST